MTFAFLVAVSLGHTCDGSVWLGPPYHGGPVRLPAQITRDRKFMVVTVCLRDRPVKFLVDTGASLTCIDQRVADDLDLVKHSTGSMRSLGGVLTPARIVVLDRVRFGPLPTRTICVAVIDLAFMNTGKERPGNVEVVGVLGSDVLSATGAVLDFTRGELVLRDPAAWHLQRMRGEWRAVSAVRGGAAVDCAGLTLALTPRRFVLRTGRADGLKVLAGDFEIERAGIPTDFRVSGVEHLDPPRAPQYETFGPLKLKRNDPDLQDICGLYEFRGDRLVMLLPSDRRGRGRAYLARPTELDPPQAGYDLITFERVPGVGRWPGPLRLGKWECDTTSDWSLIGVNRADKLRFEARLDGSVTFAPLRP